MYTNSIFYSWI